MNTAKAILGVLAGVVSGVAIGMLFASGKKQKENQLSKKGKDLADALNAKIEEKFDEILEDVTSKLKLSESKAEKRRKGEMVEH